MWRLWGVPFLLAILSGCSVEATVNQTRLEASIKLLQSMPECGRTCLINTISTSTCETGDLECSCNNANVTSVTHDCVLSACTVKESLITKNITERICERPIRDKRGPGLRGVLAGLALSCLAFVLRLISRINSPCGGNRKWGSNLWWDDAVMGFALGLIAACSYIALPMNRAGLGTDIWTVPFDNITRLLKLYYWGEDLYLTALPAVKISMLLTYLRIFSDHRFRQMVYIAIALNVCYCIAFVLVSVFQCWPINLAWLRWSKEYPGHCNDINAQGWASAGFNVILDIITLSLPLPQLWAMEMNKRKKCWVFFMFCVGFFVTIVSIVRLQVMIRFGKSMNLTWDYTAVGYWSTVELHASVCCASMPAIRGLLRRFMPMLMGTQRSAATSRYTSRPSEIHSKMGNNVTIRTMDSDEDGFYPLEEVDVKDVGQGQYGGQYNQTKPSDMDDDGRR